MNLEQRHLFMVNIEHARRAKKACDVAGREALVRAICFETKKVELARVRPQRVANGSQSVLPHLLKKLWIPRPSRSLVLNYEGRDAAGDDAEVGPLRILPRAGYRRGRRGSRDR